MDVFHFSVKKFDAQWYDLQKIWQKNSKSNTWPLLMPLKTKTNLLSFSKNEMH